MGKLPLNLIEGGKITGHRPNSAHSQNFGTVNTSGTRRSPGPKRKGVGATFAKGAVKTALNIVRR